jgi:aldehyde dehydrogenase (NAD+)
MDFTDVGFRKKKLLRLQSEILRRQADIAAALFEDFRKPEFEAYVTEIELVLAELRLHVRKINTWAKPKTAFPNLLNFPSADRIIPEPYGRVLIIAPWNYPFLLAMQPLISAVAAGNSVVLKPSELAPATARIVEMIVLEAFDPAHVEVYQGGAEVGEGLLRRTWDCIFFTGSTAVGRKVARAAAENLTPVTLELGGKNPCIVMEDADVRIAARRIAWGKFLNAGQTCIAPDYVLAHSRIKARLLDGLKSEIEKMFGAEPGTSPDFARIISRKHFQRLQNMIDPTTVFCGGQTDAATNYVAPTIIDNPPADSALMAEEIFGPLLPVVPYETDADLEREIGKHGKPLALYVFGPAAKAGKIVRKFSFGGGCINDTVIHFSNSRLPFGGVGESGLGAYHGKSGFDAFSHRKSIVRRAIWPDFPLRYAPYTGKLKWIRKIFKWF